MVFIYEALPYNLERISKIPRMPLIFRPLTSQVVIQIKFKCAQARG